MAPYGPLFHIKHFVHGNGMMNRVTSTLGIRYNITDLSRLYESLHICTKSVSVNR